MFYRVRNTLAYARFNFRTRAVRRTAPVPSAPGAGCELHTMLSAGDLPLYLIAAKSLLRFNELARDQDRRVSEYVIIGTLASFAWGLTTAFATRLVLAALSP